MTLHRRSVASGLACLSWLTWSAMASAQKPELPGRFATSAEAVVVDVVVRDANGQPARGLSSSDFSVLENGKRQRIISFQASRAPRADSPVATEGEEPGARDTGESSRGLANDPDVVALVFEQLSVGALQSSITACARSRRQA